MSAVVMSFEGLFIAIDQQDAAVLPPVRLPRFMEVYEVPRIMREQDKTMPSSIFEMIAVVDASRPNTTRRYDIVAGLLDSGY